MQVHVNTVSHPIDEVTIYVFFSHQDLVIKILLFLSHSVLQRARPTI